MTRRGPHIPPRREFTGEQPPMNKAFEDMLATAGDVEEHRMVLTAWICLAIEEWARMDGRDSALQLLDGLKFWIRNAQPRRPWKK